MKELTAEWVSKAEGDYATAGRELRVLDDPIMMLSVSMRSKQPKNI